MTSAVLFRSESKGSGFHANELLKLKTRAQRELTSVLSKGLESSGGMEGV